MVTGTITPEMTVDEVVRQFPQSLGIFLRYGVDTCCGAHEKIAVGAKASGADLEKLIAELEAMAQETR